MRFQNAKKTNSLGYLDPSSAVIPEECSRNSRLLVFRSALNHLYAPDCTIRLKHFAFLVIITSVFTSCGIRKYSTTMEQMMTTETQDIMYTEKEIGEDIDYFIQSVEEVSPFPYMNADSVSIQKMAADLKSQGDRKGNKLYVDFMRLAAAFNVGHIYTFPPEAMLDEALKNGHRFFPLFLKKNQGKWEVLGIIDQAIPEKHIGDEVISINGTEISEVINTLLPLVSDDGNSEQLIGVSLPFLLWAVNTSHPYSVKILNKETGMHEVLELQGTNNLNRYRSQKTGETDHKLDEFISFQLLDQSVGVINAKSFAFVQHKGITKAFDKELEKYFDMLKEKGVSNLIIDLRENGGGSSYPADAILRKIARKPYQTVGGSTMRVSRQFAEFLESLPWVIQKMAKKGLMKDYDNYPVGTNIKEESKPSLPKQVRNSYTGQVYVLIGTNTHSAAMIMANAVEDFNLGILVGQPTSSIPRELSNALPLKTPHAKIAFIVPSSLYTRAIGDANNFEPVNPHVLITAPEESTQRKQDLEMEYILNRIASENK